MGRYSNAKRAELAAKAAEAAGTAAQTAQAGEAVENTPSDQPTERFQQRNPSRDGAMEEVLARHHRVSGMEPEAKEPEKAPEAKKEVEKPVEAAPEAPTTPVAATPEQPVSQVAPEPIKTVRVKVDGEEFDVPQSDVEAAGGIHAYQRDKASENRLKKTTETLAETRRLQAEIAAWAQKQLPPSPPTLTDDQFIATKMDVIKFGTSEESAAALNEVLQRYIPNQNIIQNKTLIEMRRQAAVDKFREEFSEIAANPLLYKLAATIENERIAALPKNALLDAKFAQQFDFNNFYRTIGNEVRGAVGRPSQPASAPATTGGTPSQASDREARKASTIVNLPTASVRAELPKEENPGTPEEQRLAVINEMKKSRRIPVD